MIKLLLIAVTLALGVASAANTYHFTLQEPATFNGKALQPGDYKIQIEGGKATLKVGKSLVEAPAKLETAERKYPTTTISFDSVGAGKSITEIHVGGTRERIVIIGSHPAGQ